MTCSYYEAIPAVGAKNKGQLDEQLPLVPSLGRTSAKPPGLGEVVAERAEHHIVNGVRLNAVRPGPTGLG